ncbi:amidohydrolase [Paenibacillus lignilyticus]|uniref:Amidohydrolase family protein n=1 Tax=Paenibacillus lignilyticus TaxID=1172615 RepID=A0ABS5CFI9_9BACL|nr:amidohydrolase [Paenibacillus lignilyticus]MBP3964624.1 amidohydrolase family protein [Paenibacillus lignilyticus]
MNVTTYWLQNVRLETGFQRENGIVSGTETAVGHVLVVDGRIESILFEEIPAEDRRPKRDAKGMLLLPAFRDAHIHLDKTYFGGPWQAVKPARSIFDRIEEEKILLPKLLPVAVDRAKQIIELLLGFGSTHMRGHVNIEPTSELRGLEVAQQALAAYEGKLECELVAFPQHGLLRSNSRGLVKQAIEQGATHVGGLDPTSVDGDMEQSLHAMMDLAVETGAGVDMHLHEQGAAGYETMHRLAEMTIDAGWQGRVTVSHAFGFASGTPAQAEQLAERFAEAGISVASTVPIGGLVMPIPMLHRKGVKVELGTDSLTDHWSPFGNGDNLEKAGRLAEVYHMSDEYSLTRALGFITGGVLPLNEQGQRVWPAVGDDASAVLVQASCSAEAVARRAPRIASLYRGQVVSGTL